MSTVLITGASGDIGRAIALRMAKEGYNLILNYYNNETAINELTGALKASNPNCQYTLVQCDLSSFEEVSSKLSSYNIDILIHALGISYVGLLQDMSIDEWNKVINTNLTSCFNISKVILPSMISSQNGRLLFISSVWGNVGASMEVAYSASKSGLNGFVKALAKETAPSNISVNALAPGLIDTKMNNHLTKEDLDSLYEEIPSGRAGTTKEVADMAYNLITAPSYLTGQIITMDGGWT